MCKTGLMHCALAVLLMAHRWTAVLLLAAEHAALQYAPRPPRRTQRRAVRIGAGGSSLPDETRALVDAGEAPLDASYAYELRFDGGCRGNPGEGGAGAVLFKGGVAVWAGWCELPDPATTNNVAEYSAMLFGCEALSRMGVDRVSILGDSKLIISQVNGDWQTREPHLVALRDRIRATLKHFEWTATHIPRAQNMVADALANHAMDSRTSGSCAPAAPSPQAVRAAAELKRLHDAFNAERDGSAPAPPAASDDRAAARRAALATVANLRAFADAEERRIGEEYGGIS